MSDFAVDVRNVSKRFRLAHGQYNSLKERIIHGGKRQATEDFWALNEVSLTVQEGETVGILGRNGSGKSTLLKCICGVLQPTTGEVAVRGKLAGLLELGAGFQQDLTGRENIYLNGSLLGMSKRDVDRVFDAIVDFSELEEFIDGPVKFYSSGMYVRLGFAVAVNMDPDILVVDEVLAVGDERFQRKCIDRVNQFQREGRTILLVTHSADTVRSICDRGVVLSHGRLIAEGEPGEATRIFREGLMAEGAGMSIADPTLVAVPATPTSASADDLPDAERPVRFRSVHRVYSGDNTVPYMCTGDDLTIRVEFEALYPTEDVVFSLEIRDSDGNMLDAHRHVHHRDADRRPPRDQRHALRHRPDAAARRLVLVRPRDPEPGRRPLRLAGECRDVRGDEPGQGDRLAPDERARGAHLERGRRRLLCRVGAEPLSETRTMSDSEVTLPADPRAYVEQVMAEIAEEVRLRRASGDLPPKLERELDELFLAHSPVAGRGGDLGDALRMVDAATFIDPVVPVESERAAGAFVKKGMRSLLLWYVGWVTHQMSQSASAVSRALHIVDDRLQQLERQVEVQRVPGAGVVEFPALHRPDAWWVEPAVDAVAKAPGRILHAACGDGWLVRRIVAAGGDAYGVDPRSHIVDASRAGLTGPARREPSTSTCARWPRPAWAASC